MLTLGFPTGMLFDVMMRGGPIPDRYEPLGRGLIDPGRLDFEPEEAVLIREWLSMQPDDVIDVDERDAVVAEVNKALRQAGACSECGGPFVADNQQGQPCCGRCGSPWEA